MKIVLFCCTDCHRSFMWALVESTENRWHGEILMDGKPTYCPCCGAFDCITPGKHSHTVLEGEV